MPEPRPPAADDTPARRLLLAAIIAIAGAIAYANSFQGAFIFDDYASIHRNPLIQRLETSLQTPTDATYTVSGRPLLSLSLGLNFAAGELRPTGYHAVNLVLHLMNALLVFGIVRRLLSGGRRPMFPPATALGAAFAVALLWVLHPLQTASVTYIIQRAESLMALCFLTTVYTAIRGFVATRAAAWFGLAVIACWLGAGAKEVIAVAPLLVLALDRVFFSASWGEALKRRAAFYGLLAVTWGLVAALVFTSARSETSVDPFLTVGAFEYLLTQAGVIVHYLRLSAWPEPLILHYGWPVARAAGDWLVPGIVVTVSVLATVWLVARGKPLGFAGLWFFAILAPSSSLIAIPREIAAEHRMYLPLVAVLAVLVVAATRVVARRGAAGTIGMLLVVIAAVGCGILTWRRNAQYASPTVMWRHVVTERPGNALAWSNLGVELARSNDGDEALAAFERAAALRPDHPDFLANLGGALLKARRFAEAIPPLEEAVKRAPSAFGPNYNLALALIEGRRDFNTARPFATRAANLMPGDPRAMDLAARVLDAVGDHPALIALLEGRLKRGSAPMAVHLRLAATHARFGNPARALEIGDSIHRAQPGVREATLLIAWLRAAHGSPAIRDPQAAIAAIDRTTKHLGGKSANLEAARAAALAKLGKFADAIRVAEVAAKQAAKLGDPALAKAINRDLAGYRDRRPARIPWE